MKYLFESILSNSDTYATTHVCICDFSASCCCRPITKPHIEYTTDKRRKRIYKRIRTFIYSFVAVRCSRTTQDNSNAAKFVLTARWTLFWSSSSVYAIWCCVVFHNMRCVFLASWWWWWGWYILLILCERSWTTTTTKKRPTTQKTLSRKYSLCVIFTLVRYVWCGGRHMTFLVAKASRVYSLKLYMRWPNSHTHTHTRHNV